MLIRTIVLLLLGAFLAACSDRSPSPSSFSFAGTKWGESMQAVDQRLRDAGFGGLHTLVFQTREKGPVRSRYFEGALFDRRAMGFVYFENDALVYVSITVSPNSGPNDGTCAVIEKSLRERYGNPTSTTEDASRAWKHPSGDSINLACARDGAATVEYASKRAGELRRANERTETNKL